MLAFRGWRGFRYHLCATLKRTNQCEDRKLSIGTCGVTDYFGCPCRTGKYTPIMCPQRGLIPRSFSRTSFLAGTN
jgi:hypothetical protein